MNRLYAYLYDDFLSDAVFQKPLANLETRTSILGIQGRTSRLAIFRSARELVAQLVHDGAQTIVVVGNDRTLQKVMWFLPDLPIIIGYIPVAEPCSIARILGIPMGDAACDVLSARRVETLDIGKIADRYFLTEAVIRDTTASVHVGNAFRVRSASAGTITLRNLSMTDSDDVIQRAKDGWLDLTIDPVVSPERTGWRAFSKGPVRTEQVTHLLLSHGRIESEEPVDVLVDGHQLNGFGFSVGILPGKLRMITGRNKRLEGVSGALPNRTRFDMLTPAQ